jgi:hypothetical protein
VSEAQRESEKDPTLALRLAEAAMNQNNIHLSPILLQYLPEKLVLQDHCHLKKKTSAHAFTAVVFSADGNSILQGQVVFRGYGKVTGNLSAIQAHTSTVWSVGFSKDENQF